MVPNVKHHTHTNLTACRDSKEQRKASDEMSLSEPLGHSTSRRLLLCFVCIAVETKTTHATASSSERLLLAGKDFCSAVGFGNSDVVYDEDDKLKVELEIEIKQHKNA